MGRPLTIDDLFPLDVGDLSRLGYLEPGSRPLGWREDGRLAAAIIITTFEGGLDLVGYWGETQKMSVTIALDSTPGTTGGTRRWLLCPKCGRRCQKLSVLESGIRCRKCWGLPYLSSVLSKTDRIVLRREKYRRAVHLDERGRTHRPKGMHLETWMRLLAVYDAAEMAVIDHL
jgi:hypothetical protein